MRVFKMLAAPGGQIPVECVRQGISRSFRRVYSWDGSCGLAKTVSRCVLVTSTPQMWWSRACAPGPMMRRRRDECGCIDCGIDVVKIGFHGRLAYVDLQWSGG